MIQTAAAIVIHRPIDEVFRFGADLAAFPLWVSEARFKPLSTAHLATGRALKRP